MNQTKKQDTEPDNEVSEQAPQQEKDDAGPVDLKEIRQKIKYLVSREAVKMVAKILKKKSDPSYLALKYLFEIAGLYPAGAAEEAEQEDSLAKILLRHLGLEDEIKTGSEVTKDKQASAPAEQKDALE